MVTSTKRSSSKRSSRTTSRARTTKISRNQDVDVQKRFEELISSLRELFANSNASRRRTSSTARGRSKATTAARLRRQTKRS